MYPTTGYHHELSPEQKSINELRSVRLLAKLHPENKYWQNMLAEIEAKKTSKLTDPREPWQIDLDEMGQDNPWDYTPTPKGMPIIDFDNINEIPF